MIDSLLQHRKQLLIAAGLIIGVGIIAFVVWSIITRPAAEIPVVVQASNTDIKNAVSTALSDTDTMFRTENLQVDKQVSYQDKWIIAGVSLIDEPDTSEGKYMIYVFQVDSGKLTLIGYSGDSFSEYSFPGYTVPDSLIERANRPL